MRGKSEEEWTEQDDLTSLGMEAKCWEDTGFKDGHSGGKDIWLSNLIEVRNVEAVLDFVQQQQKK